MDVVILLVMISLSLVAASLFFFFHRLREGDFDHAERLALAPLDDDPSLFSTHDGAARPAGADRSKSDTQSSEGLEGGSSNASR